MRQQFIHLLFALPIVLLVGCSNDELTDSGLITPGSDSNIRFEIGFAPQTRVTTDATFTSTWEHGDAIGIFAVPHGDALATSDNYVHNVRLTYKETTVGDPTTGTWGLDAGVELLWPKNGGLLDFYAYYPYSDNNAAPESLDPTAMDFSVMADQSANTDGKSNYNLSELLIVKADNSGSGYGKGSTVALSFVHAMAMVQVEFDLTECYVSPATTVQLMGCATDARLNLNHAGTSAATTTTTSTATLIRMYRVEQSGDSNYQSSFKYRALVPAQDVAVATILFQTQSENVTFQSEPLQSALQLTAGTAEVFGQVVESEDYVPFITDANFKSRCLSRFDKDGDGKLSRKEVLDVTTINVVSQFIGSLEGINHFRNLTYLNCSGNRLTQLDVSGLTSLTNLFCYGNTLTELDVSGLTSLTDLFCFGNTLTELDVSGLTSLTNLFCYGNTLTELDVSGLTSLTYLDCSSNSLTQLDVSALTSLTYLNCYGNLLTQLDVSGLTSLSTLDCFSNTLTELDVSGLTNLTELNCSYNSLTQLDVSGNDALRQLECGDGTGTTPLTVWIDPNKELATSNTIGKLWVRAIEIDNNGYSTLYHNITTKDAAPVFGVTVSNKP